MPETFQALAERVVLLQLLNFVSPWKILHLFFAHNVSFLSVVVKLEESSSRRLLRSKQLEMSEFPNETNERDVVNIRTFREVSRGSE